MSKIALEGNASGTGTFTIASPNSNSNYTLTLPSSTGTVVVTGGAQTIEFAAGTAASPSITFTGDTNTGIFSPGADTIAFTEGGAEAMRIDSSGNVGVGTSSNIAKFDVLRGSTSTTLFDESQMYLINNGTATANQRVDIGLRFQDGTYNGVGGIAMLRESSTARSGALIFCPIPSDGNGTERARITSGGYFKASNTGTYNGSTGSYHEFYQTSGVNTGLLVRTTNASFSANTLEIAADRNTSNNSYYFMGASVIGVAYRFLIADSGNVTNTNGSYGTISDVKLKQDIVDAGSQWDDIKNLRFRKYRLKSEVELDPNAKPFLGLVAQEAELVSPGLIEEHKDTKQEIKTREVEKTREIPAVLDEEGNEVEPARTETYTETEEYTETVDLGTTTKSIKTSILYMKAVKALQEAMTRIEALEAEVAAMKGQ